MRLLDLFCGAGGAAEGYRRAGFEVVGIDIEPQPHYPFEFHRGDAIELGYELLGRGGFVAVHASPPCQAWSDLAYRTGRSYPELIEPVRALMQWYKLPCVIENVEGAPLINPITLCGVMFKGLRVLRHRLFECSFPIVAPPHGKHPLVFTHDKRKAHYGRLDQSKAFVQVTGGAIALWLTHEMQWGLTG